MGQRLRTRPRELLRYGWVVSNLAGVIILAVAQTSPRHGRVGAAGLIYGDRATV